MRHAFSLLFGTRVSRSNGYLLVLVCSLIGFTGNTSANSSFTIAFGSCALETKAQPIWNDIAVKTPDAFLFIGDNQYADVQYKNGERVRGPVTNPARFKEAYEMVDNIPEFRAFRQKVPLLMGTWDDHDYGMNDAGKEFTLKKESQEAFLDFFNFAKDHELRSQAGIYHANIIEDAGHRVQIIMLDTRFNRDPLTKNPSGRPPGKGPYIPNSDTKTSILGAAQWDWLKAELNRPADVRIVVSSIQVVAFEHGWEGWGTMPHERQRLFDLIGETQANGVIFLSGDRHLMEISKDTGQLGHTVPYPMWDFTSSGLTQDYSEVSEGNTFRVGKVAKETHYGSVEILWNEADLMTSEIKLSALGLNNKLIHTTSIVLSELQAN